MRRVLVPPCLTDGGQFGQRGEEGVVASPGSAVGLHNAAVVRHDLHLGDGGGRVVQGAEGEQGGHRGRGGGGGGHTGGGAGAWRVELWVEPAAGPGRLVGEQSLAATFNRLNRLLSEFYHFPLIM